MPDIHVVILAAGQGTRMKSRLPKVLHPIAGRPMVEHVLRTAESVSPATITLIVGHRADMVRERLAGRPPLQFALQEPQLGTAHALQQAEPVLAGRTGTRRPAVRGRAASAARDTLRDSSRPIVRPTPPPRS